MEIRKAFWVLPVLAVALAAPAMAQDPLKVAPKVYHKKLENARVRVFEVTFSPGQSIGMHSHPDHAVYVITPGTLEITEKGKKAVVMKLKAGDTVFLPAQSHSARNLGKTTVKLVVTEIKG